MAFILRWYSFTVKWVFIILFFTLYRREWGIKYIPKRFLEIGKLGVFENAMFGY